MRRFSHLALANLIVILGIVLWGAYVRASGSGAGCGSHWPTCNGALVPDVSRTDTVVEFAHRATSGVGYLLVVLQAAWAVRAFPRRHKTRRASLAVLLFMTSEALVGAGLVLLELVATNTSTARGLWMAAHLVNTFLLLGAQTLTVRYARQRASDPRSELTEEVAPGTRLWSKPIAAASALAVLGFLLIGVSGAIAALGDTLFPSNTFAEGLSRDLDATAHVFLRLRVLHPIAALVVGAYVLGMGTYAAAATAARGVRRSAILLIVAFSVQLVVGFVNLALLAPVAMQLLHLLFADLTWIALTSFVATLYATRSGDEPTRIGARQEAQAL